MKDYKIKEALCNLKQSVDYLRAGLQEIEAKFSDLVEILDEKRREENE